MGLRQTISDTASESRFDAILNAAEKVFATAGYEGAALREIADKAGVAQGLIHYHFETKEKLFESMVARRSAHINDQRAVLLKTLMEAPQSPDLEQITEALFRPTIETGLSLADDGGAFAKVLVSVANSAGERDQQLAEKYYDPIARQFIAALIKVEPGLSRKDAVWAYMFAIGVGMTMMARTGRPARLSAGECDDGNADEMLARIVPFICGGIRALVQEQPITN